MIELPHLKDEYALNDFQFALKRFYVVQDVIRPSNGFSPTWYPHLLRVKCVPLVDSQEFSDILNADAGAGDGTTIRDLISARDRDLAINDAIISQAEKDADLSGYDTRQLYILPRRCEDGLIDVQYAGDDDVYISQDGHTVDASTVYKDPKKNYYISYLPDDGSPPNGIPYTFGISFPTGNLVEGQFHLRTDYFPNRLYRYTGSYWAHFEDNVRMTLTNTGDPNANVRDSSTSTYTTESRQTQKFSFINNVNTATIDGKVVPERQYLSKILRPKADN